MLNLAVRKVHYAAYYFATYSKNHQFGIHPMTFFPGLACLPRNFSRCVHQNFVRSCLLFVRVSQYRPSLQWRSVTPLFFPQSWSYPYSLYVTMYSIYSHLPRLPLVCLHVAH